MEEKIFTLKEVSRYLKIPKSTLYKLSERGKIPHSKIGKQLRFRKSSIDQWLTEKESQTKTLAEENGVSSEESSASQPSPKRVLLIDDDTLVLKTLGRILKNSGFSVEPAQSGEEALEKGEKENFDLVIADVRMPGISGIETIRRLRQINQRYNRALTPEIVITGYMDTQAEKEAADLGISHYLYKPFAIADFTETVKKTVSDLN